MPLSPARYLLALVALLVLPVACACAPTPPRAAPPPSPPAAPPVASTYRSVHIDTLAGDKVALFENARREWLGELQRAHASDGRGVFLQVGASQFYTVRSFALFAENDTRGEAIERSLATLPKGAGERYDRGDDALVFPHTSEIWQADADLSYAPDGGPLTERTACCGRLVLEDVRPDPASGARYGSASGEINRALGEAHYPLTRASFRTVYGAGHLVTLWLAPSKEVLDAAPSVEAAVARVRGAAPAAALMAACEASVERRVIEPLVVRRDLSQ